MKKTTLILIAFFAFMLNFNAQKTAVQDIKFPESFALGKQDFLQPFQLIPAKTFREFGYEFSSNPGIIKDKIKFSPFIEDFKEDDIAQIYFEIYADKTTPKSEALAIVVAEFRTEELLTENLQVIDKSSLRIPAYFITGRYLIIIRTEDQNLIKNKVVITGTALDNDFSSDIKSFNYDPQKNKELLYDLQYISIKKDTVAVSAFDFNGKNREEVHFKMILKEGHWQALNP